MFKKGNKEAFISKAKIIHADKYCYDNVEYINSSTKIIIICPQHGEFTQAPNHHIEGQGCRKCMINSLKGLIYGVGINDCEIPINSNGCRSISYQTWHGMIERCYNQKSLEKEPTYRDCIVCKEWFNFSNFKEWFDKNYIEGYQLDKDILYKGNKVYSPTTCVWIPQEINLLLVRRNAKRGKYPIGVCYCKNHKKFQVGFNIKGKRKSLGYFDTIEDAFNAYKKAKENHIREIAEEYYNNKKISKEVYNALISYEVEITD